MFSSGPVYLARVTPLAPQSFVSLSCCVIRQVQEVGRDGVGRNWKDAGVGDGEAAGAPEGAQADPSERSARQNHVRDHPGCFGCHRAVADGSGSVPPGNRARFEGMRSR